MNRWIWIVLYVSIALFLVSFSLQKMNSDFATATEKFTTEGTDVPQDPPVPTPSEKDPTAPEPEGQQDQHNDPSSVAEPQPIVYDNDDSLPPMEIPEGNTDEENELATQIITIYQQVLNRSPSSREFQDKFDAINTGSLSIEGLQMQLFSSPEYSRMIKVQMNSTAPELLKITNDLVVIRKVISLYNSVFGKEPYPTLRLPLKDAYVYLNFKDEAFLEMLHAPLYKKWESFVLQTPNMGRVDVEASIETYFIRDTLLRKAGQLPDQQSATRTGTVVKKPTTGSGSATGANVNVNGDGLVTEDGKIVLERPNIFIIQGGDAQTITRAIQGQSIDNLGATSGAPVTHSDGSIDPMIQSIQSKAFNRDIPATAVSYEQEGRVYYPESKLVLRPEFAWAGPLRTPPVCTTLKSEPVTVGPMLESSKLLLGTPLNEAINTEVGTIMPKFEYMPYSS